MSRSKRSEKEDEERATTTSNTTNRNNNSNATSSIATTTKDEKKIGSLPKLSPRDDFIGILSDRVVEAINENLDGPIIQQTLEKYLPHAKESIRSDLPFYDSTLEILKYQRDNYLIGTKYAERKQQHRQGQFPYNRFGIGSPRMPNNATAFAYIELVKLGSWFIPSTTIKDALLPIVLSLPSGALNDTITSTVSNTIALAQPSLDITMKNAILGVFDDPQIRQLIKSRTQKILRVNDDNNNDNNNDNTVAVAVAAD
mmetsp:Transcript_17545/g.17692  ORF Transcript_17545/g.17692 Transcript_17545/m.17692 type:complete len:256 (+) Transcript_17545:322-1089(+)